MCILVNINVSSSKQPTKNNPLTTTIATPTSHKSSTTASPTCPSESGTARVFFFRANLYTHVYLFSAEGGNFQFACFVSLPVDLGFVRLMSSDFRICGCRCARRAVHIIWRNDLFVLESAFDLGLAFAVELGHSTNMSRHSRG